MSSNTPSRPPRLVNIWVLLTLAVVVLGLVVWQQRGDEQAVEADAGAGLGRPDAESHESVIVSALDDLRQAWHDRDRNAFIAAAGSTAAAKSWAAQTYDNLDELGVASIDPELVPGGPQKLHKDGSFRAKVEVSWVPGASTGLPARPTDKVRVSLGVRAAKGGFSIESAAPSNDPMPIWLEGALDVIITGDRTVVRIDGGSDVPRLEQMLGRADADVRTVYGDAAADPIVVIPRESSQSTDIVGGDPARLSQIAAITTTLDGSESSRAPVAVVLNPKVFTPMDARAAQIVLTHEVTHDVTGATTAVAPLWVVEGYADYVALSRDQLDPTRSASQILKQVRGSGPPKALPSDDDFGFAADRLGATYESAWMVFRMLGESYDDATIAGFYRRVLHGQDTDVAARAAFGVDLSQITTQWRDYLRTWARVR